MDGFSLSWLFAGLVFLLAGVVKGVIGMGLPTIAMGLLSLVFAPVEAAALLVMPSLVTNVWQLLAGPSWIAPARRLWSMMAGVVVGTLLASGVLASDVGGVARLALGLALVAYAVIGLSGARFSLAARHEAWASPVVGATTGFVTGATGVFVLPAVPYLQAIGLDKDDLVQALGLSFTVSTLALAGGLLQGGGFSGASAAMSLAGLAPALAGMAIGQVVRRHIAPVTFRRVFFAGLFLLGTYLIVRQIA
ncbi:sulfite exporter TauE/SafE family protein [Reyranella sp.]|uniref:sulfite exporter TauE/SafE family protein n=1 Tax=Reyranella sp. TaxID=1929291 RepID=UPI0037835692